ncbi:hypothetical protein PS2_018997 [Malus domestica]
MANTLANLASSMALGQDEAADMPVRQRWVIPFVTETLQTSSQYFQSTLKSGDSRWSVESFQTILDVILNDVDEHLASSTTKEHSIDIFLKEYF